MPLKQHAAVSVMLVLGLSLSSVAGYGQLEPPSPQHQQLLIGASERSRQLQPPSPQAQAQMAADGEEQARLDKLRVPESKTLEQKLSIDFLSDVDVVPILFSHTNDVKSVAVTVNLNNYSDSYGRARVSDTFGTAHFLDRVYNLDSCGQRKTFDDGSTYTNCLDGFSAKNDEFHCDIKLLLPKSDWPREAPYFTLEGKLQGTDISCVVKKSGDTPLSLAGTWGEVKFEATMTKSNSVPWLLERANYTVTKAGASTHYEVVFQHKSEEIDRKTAVRYSGYTVTKK